MTAELITRLVRRVRVGTRSVIMHISLPCIHVASIAEVSVSERIGTAYGAA